MCSIVAMRFNKILRGKKMQPYKPKKVSMAAQLKRIV